MEIECVEMDVVQVDNQGGGDVEADAAAMINGRGVAEITEEIDAILEVESFASEEIVDKAGEVVVEDCPAIDIDSGWLPRAKAEIEHEQELRDMKEAHSLAALAREEVEAAFKLAKAEEKAALKNLSNLIRRGPAYPQPQSATDPQSDKISQAVADGGEPAHLRSSSLVDDPNADQSWRSIPTSEIISGIKGMGAKKLDAIVDLAPTLGHIEDLRGQAGLAHKKFKEVLPRGVGEAMADEIEERVLSKMREHQRKLAELTGELGKAIELEEAIREEESEEEQVAVEVEIGVEYEDI